jgi:hypothetical protein
MNRNLNNNNRRRRAIQNNNSQNSRRVVSLGLRRALNLNANGTPRRTLPRRNPRMRVPNRQQSGSMFDPPLVRNRAPIQNTANNQSRVIHREPLSVLIGSTGFAITTFQINPGLASTFPWLSSQANAYESYKINALHIQYRHTTNEFTGKGTIVIAPDYDAADSPPTSIVAAEQMADSVQGACTRDWTCILRPRGIGILGPKRYTRSGALSANEDIKTYDIAQIHVCTSGQADAVAQIGQLWVYYDITLSEPQPVAPGNIFLAGQLENVGGEGMSITNYPGSDEVASGSIVISSVNNILTLTELIPGQTYFALVEVQAAVLTTDMVLTPDGTNLTLIGQSPVEKYGGTIHQSAWITFNAAAPTGIITLSGITVMTTPNYFVISVTGMIANSNIIS